MYTERQDQIIKYLADVKFAKIEQLAKEFDVSNETIRRDLFDLEREGVIKRIRGGAVFNTLLAHEMEFSKKLGNHQEEKQAIARTAVEYIDDNDAIAMSNGTTNIALARQLARMRQNLTIITNSHEVAAAANEGSSHKVILTGGQMRKHNGSMIGSLCLDCIGQFRVDKAIVNIDGVSIENGVMEYNTEEAAVIRHMLSISQTKMVLAEYRKFNEMAMNVICPAAQIDVIVTDWNVSAKEIKAWAEAGVKRHFRRKRIRTKFEFNVEFANKRHKAICEFFITTQKDDCYKC